MNKIISIALFFISAGNCFGQQVTFQKTFGGTHSDKGFFVQQTTDGGYIITGFTDVTGNSDIQIYLLKTDAYGDTAWTKIFGGIDIENALSVQQTADGGYIVCGTSWATGAGYADLYLIKTDTNGNPLWTKTYGGTDDDYGWSVRQTADGGYIMTGFTGSFGVIGSGAYLVRTDGNGDTLWTKIFSPTGAERGYDVRQTADGGFIVTGITSYVIFGYSDVYLIKTDTAGNPLWNKAYGGNTADVGYSVQQTTDGGYIVSGYTTNFGAGITNIFLLKTDGNGDTLWTKTYGGTGNDYGQYVQQTADGGYIITGIASSFGAGNSDVYLVKTDSSGNVLWSKTFGGTSIDEGRSVQQTADGGYIVTGQAAYLGAGSSDVYLIKTDANGNSGCNEGNPATIVTSPAPVTASLSTTVFSDGIVANYNFNVTNGGIITTLCFATGIESEIQNLQSAFTISPNPTTNNFTITFPNTINKGSIEIYTVLGKKILEENISNASQKEIHLKNTAAGIYFVKVQDQEKGYCEKLVVEN